MSAGVAAAGSDLAIQAGLDITFEQIAGASILGAAGAAAVAVDLVYNNVPIVKNTVKGAENLVTNVFKGLGIKF